MESVQKYRDSRQLPGASMTPISLHAILNLMLLTLNNTPIYATPYAEANAVANSQRVTAQNYLPNCMPLLHLSIQANDFRSFRRARLDT
jgi:hypothetical protein